MNQLSPIRCSIYSFGSVYTTPGSADAVLAALRAGSDKEAARLFNMSLLYYRGDWQASAEEARTLLQSEIGFEARLFASQALSLEAMYLGDDQKWLLSRQLLGQTPADDDGQRARIAFNLAAMDSSIYVKASFPPWFREGVFDSLPIEDYPFARYIYAKLLYMEGAYDKLTAVSGVLISQSKAENALLSEIYLRIVAAMGFHATGDEASVEKHLQAALKLALPDKLYAPFAENRRNLGAAVDRLMREADPEGFKIIAALNEIVLEGWTNLYNRLYGKKISNDMTPREYDVARLAFQGLTNKEIADRLGISTNTVKLYLRVVFEKLSINRREELTPYVWEEAAPLPETAPF